MPDLHFAGGNEVYLFFTNGRPLWVPVTCEEFINSRMRDREKELEQRRASAKHLEKEWQTQRVGKERRTRELEKIFEQAEKDPEKRKKMLRDALEVAAIMEAKMKKSVAESQRLFGESERSLLGPLRNQLACMSPAERAAPAWYKGIDLVGAGTPGARELVTLNLDYFDSSKPRTDIQLIVVTLNSQNEDRTGPTALTSAIRLDEFLATADWPGIASFVVPAAASAKER